MLYLRYIGRRLVKEYIARDTLQRFVGYGASIHRRGKTNEFDLLVPVTQTRAQHQAEYFEKNFPGEFELCNVRDFAYGAQFDALR